MTLTVDEDDVKPTAVDNAPATPNKAEEEEPMECEVKCDGSSITWTQAVPVQLLNGGHHHHDWHHKTSVRGVHVCDGSDPDGLVPLKYYFNTAFPFLHLHTIVRLTNEKLELNYQHPTNIIKILKFFGLLLLIPCLPLIPRKELWTVSSCTKYTQAVNLGKARMT